MVSYDYYGNGDDDKEAGLDQEIRKCLHRWAKRDYGGELNPWKLLSALRAEERSL